MTERTDALDNASRSYSERNSVSNIGELIFEEYCKERGYYYRRIGFDEKADPLPSFFSINPVLRNLPDYFAVNTAGQAAMIMVKGTMNLKRSEYLLLPKLVDAYSSDRCPLLYSFCIKGRSPMFLTPADVALMYQRGTDRVWNDGVAYRALTFSPSF